MQGCVSLVALMALPFTAMAASPKDVEFKEQSSQCGALFARHERLNAIPHHLLRAVAMTESGRASPDDGRIHPWPWAVNANGKGFYFDSKREAMAAVTSWMKKGVKSVDVGCMQVSMLYHGAAFDSMEKAFDPEANVAYAARFLRSHFDRTGSWRRAVAAYHSQTPELGKQYAYRVVRHWYGLVAGRRMRPESLPEVSAVNAAPHAAHDDWASRSHGAAASFVAKAVTHPVTLPAEQPMKPVQVSAAQAESRMFQDSGQDLVKAVLAEKRGTSATMQMVGGRLVNMDSKQPMQQATPQAMPQPQMQAQEVAQQMPPQLEEPQPPAVARAPHMDGVWQIKKPQAQAVPLRVMQPHHPYAHAVPMQPTYPVAPEAREMHLGYVAAPPPAAPVMQGGQGYYAMPAQPQPAMPPMTSSEVEVQQAYEQAAPAIAQAQIMPAVAQLSQAEAQLPQAEATPAPAMPRRNGSLSMNPDVKMVFRY
jgi:hypothetical protein